MKTGLFGNLLFSAPNHLGGLYACMEDGQILHLDDRGTCGLHWSMNGPFLRGIQLEDRLAITDRNGTREHTGEWGDLHDVLLDGEDVYLVSTQHNAVIRWNIQKEKEMERWVFSGQEDSWHINCLGWLHGALCFAAFGDYPIARGYKLNTSEQGFLRRLHGNTRLPLVSGLSQPHSILEFDNQWFFLQLGNPGNLACDRSRISAPRHRHGWIHARTGDPKWSAVCGIERQPEHRQWRPSGAGANRRDRRDELARNFQNLPAVHGGVRYCRPAGHQDIPAPCRADPFRLAYSCAEPTERHRGKAGDLRERKREAEIQFGITDS